jgi:hypothetical protein
VFERFQHDSIPKTVCGTEAVEVTFEKRHGSLAARDDKSMQAAHGAEISSGALFIRPGGCRTVQNGPANGIPGGREDSDRV